MRVEKQVGPTAIAVLVTLMLGAGSSLAMTLDYTVAGSATLNGNVEIISGTFTYDPTTKNLFSTDLTLTGSAPFAGTYAENAVVLTNGTFITAPASSVPAVELGFADLLSGGPDVIKSVTFFFPTGLADATSVSGSATPAVTPLPAALPLYATGLGALALLRWRRKRRAQAIA
jgi:hypothetical protein